MLLATFGVTAYGAPTKDACLALIPEHLSAALKQKFPGYRPPVASDNLAEDIEWNIRNGGNGCLGVAIADFDGDGNEDFLLGLTSLTGEGALITVAFARGRSWDFHTLDSWKDGRVTLYVAAEKPGRFKRTEALDGPLEKGEKETMTCANSGALFGATESSGVVYCFAKGEWHYVWVSD